MALPHAPPDEDDDANQSEDGERKREENDGVVCVAPVHLVGTDRPRSHLVREAFIISGNVKATELCCSHLLMRNFRVVCSGLSDPLFFYRKYDLVYDMCSFLHYYKSMWQHL